MTADIEKGASHTNGTIQRKPKKRDIMDLVGKEGPWQRRILLVVLFVAIPTATHTVATIFLAPNLDYWCARPAGVHNLSLEQWRSTGLPPEDKQCSRYEFVNFTSLLEEAEEDMNETEEYRVVPCDTWEYDNTFYRSTVLSQWDVVCGREWLKSVSNSVFIAGILTAALLFGYIGDRFGRRLAMSISAFIGVSSVIICAFSTSYPMFIVVRFFIALGITGCFNSAFVLLMEVVGPEMRPIYGMFVLCSWSLGIVSLPAIAWVLRDWFWIQVMLGLPCLVMLFMWWMVPESPRWLMSQGKGDEVHKILCQAAELNGISLSNIDSMLKKVMAKANEVQESNKSEGNLFGMLKTPGLWQTTLIVYFMWFVNAFVCYGLSYDTNQVAEDPFVNFAVSAAVDFPAYFFSTFAMRMLGRRNPLAGCMVIGGLACLLSYPLPQNPWWLTVTVSMVGKFCLTCAFGIICVFTMELSPTVVRNIGFGSASLCARLGSVLAPFIRESGVATHPVLPQIAFGVLAAISGALVLLLPETNNCSLAYTLQEAAEASKRRTKKPATPNGNHVIVTLSNEDSETPAYDLNSQAVFAPSPKPQTNGKKLADVPEEDSHCEPEEVESAPADQVPEPMSGCTNAALDISPEDATETAVGEAVELMNSGMEASADPSPPETLKVVELSEIVETEEHLTERSEQKSEL